MNTLTGSSHGVGYVVLVLEPGNLYKLQQGEPIQVRVEDHFPDGIPKKLQLVVHFSETPIADARSLAQEHSLVFDERTPEARKIRPHCPECRSTMEQYGLMRDDTTHLDTVFCSQCGAVLGIFVHDEKLNALVPSKPIVGGGSVESQ